MVKGIGGRPPKTEESLIDRELRPYFQMGVSAKKASLQTGYNYNTCKVRWAKWKSNPDADHLEEISERQRKSTAQFLSTYDDIIFGLNVQLQELTGLKLVHKKQYEQHKNIKIKEGIAEHEIDLYEPNWDVEDRFTKLQVILADIVDKRTAVLNAPYIDEDSETATLYRLQEKMKKQRVNHMSAQV